MLLVLGFRFRAQVVELCVGYVCCAQGFGFMVCG